MTVQELIDTLSHVEDKSLEVWVGKIDKNLRFNIIPANTVTMRTISEDEVLVCIERDENQP